MPASTAGGIRPQMVQVQEVPVQPPVNMELYWGSVVGLVTALSSLAAVIVIRRLKKHHWEAVAVAIAVAVACVVMMAIAQAWRPPTELLIRVMPYACLLAWMSVILVAWVLVQRDLRHIQKQALGSENELAGQIRVVTDRLTSNHEWASTQFEIQREALRNEFVNLVTDQAGTLEWLKKSVDLIHSELRKIPDRTKADLDRIRGPEHRVTNGNTGESLIRPPKFPNIEEISEQLDQTAKKLDALVKLLDQRDKERDRQSLYEKGVKG